MFTRIAKGLWKHTYDDREDLGRYFTESEVEYLPEDAQSDWKVFRQTYNYRVGEPVQISENTQTNMETYQQLLLDILHVRFENSPETGSKYFQRAMDWLKGTDFFEAPASSYYHESFPGGLVYHTLKVYNKLCELQFVESFKMVRFDSAALTALVHDWCKIGLYESYEKNVKNDQTGKWEKQKAFRRGKPKFPFGHGDASLFLANRFFPLTVEESLAIRWHMGKYYVHDAEDNDLQTANETYPIVHMLQFADELSITNYNN